jgi:alkylated DNA repair protein (DNA oxidative demethylase)
MIGDLFASTERPRVEPLAEGAMVLRGFALDRETDLIGAFEGIAAASPFRHLVTPGGHTMSVAMTNCGAAGWVSDRRGYRYDTHDPLTGKPWPPMPAVFLDVAVRAASEAGFGGFAPNVCLINLYEPGSRLTLHQDKDELDYGQPIVSVSLGLPAKFLFGGLERTDKPLRTMLEHGDVVVWGGPSRLAYHGVDTLKDGHHPLLGRRRINLTFRSAV